MATSFGSPFRYWGKARPVADGPACHLLVWHSLDVAAVAHSWSHI
ncbi:HD domain-containing protein [Leptothrix sp. BB-4]